jgi:hypothetical protein
MKRVSKEIILILLFIARILCLEIGIFIIIDWADSNTSHATTMPYEKQKADTEKDYPQDVPHKFSAVFPNVQQRVHRVGLLNICMTNWGFFGSGRGHPSYDLRESLGGCFSPNPYEEVFAPSAEYPPRSGLEYLFWGGLWIGAMVDSQYYTTVGCDGWQLVHELFPDGPAPKGAIEERSTRPAAFCYSPDAISEQDIIAVYTDSSADIPLSRTQRDPFDLRKHFPLYVQITQRSYSWSYEYAEDFVLIDFTIKNMWTKEEGRPPQPPKIHDDEVGIIRDMYVGLYIDADCGHIDEDPYGAYGAQDDICGFRELVTSPKPEEERNCYDTVNVAWIADNDGHGGMDGGEAASVFSSKSPIAVTGVRVVRSPQIGLKYSFNWFISHTSGAPRDWGPWKVKSQRDWADMNPYGTGNNFPDNVLGTPGGDVSKYFMMSNREFDYDQIYSCVWPSKYPDEGWLPANATMCADLADGFDTRYLLSFGPFDELGPGESLMITIGYIAGDDFHVDPINLAKNQGMKDPDRFYANLDFIDFETNATWAVKVYDNPEPGFPCGDGIPDFKGPPPSPSPLLSFHTERGKVKISWNGKFTERFRDPFNGRLDFEGYRIYMSRTGLTDDYALLGSYDKIDYKVYKLNRDKFPTVWDWKVASADWEFLEFWLEGRGIESLGDDPLVWTKDHPFVIGALEDTFFIYLSDSLDQDGIAVPFDSIKLEPRDSLYFEPHDWNVGFDSIVVNHAYRDSVDSGWVSDTADHYWDYEYEIDAFPGEPLYFAVTAYDVGNPQTGLSSLEGSKQSNAVWVYAFDEPEVVEKKGSGVIVYPNPYRIDGSYYPEYEKGDGNFDKRLRFLNLPTQCTIRIYTLDGDLVRTLEHDKQEGDLNATYHYWDLVSRNTQAVVSGIYLFCVEDKKTGETQVGKFVIIK